MSIPLCYDNQLPVIN